MKKIVVFIMAIAAVQSVRGMDRRTSFLMPSAYTAFQHTSSTSTSKSSQKNQIGILLPKKNNEDKSSIKPLNCQACVQQRRIEDAEKKITKQRSSIQDLELSPTLPFQNSCLLNAVRDSDNRNKQLKAEIATLKSEIDQKTSEIDQKTSEIDQKTSEVNFLKSCCNALINTYNNSQIPKENASAIEQLTGTYTKHLQQQDMIIKKLNQEGSEKDISISDLSEMKKKQEAAIQSLVKTRSFFIGATLFGVGHLAYTTLCTHHPALFANLAQKMNLGLFAEKFAFAGEKFSDLFNFKR